MPTIEFIARGVVLRDQQLLLCQASGKEHFYLPGGHVEFGETAVQALHRELIEEIGVAMSDEKYMGTVEHIYEGEDGPHHEVNIVFAVTIPGEEIKALEPHISFSWQPIDQLTAVTILPKPLLEAIQGWLEDGRPFWRQAAV